MPLYMDIHTVPGATPEALREAHDADLAVQHKHHVCYHKYWFNEEAGKVFCLVEAPNPEAAAAVHRDAHGLVAEKIIEVDPDMADGLLGPGVVNSAGAVLQPDQLDRKDSGIRSIMFTDIVGSTEMCSRHGDDAAIAMLSVHDRIVRSSVGAHNGREVKHTGDGIMAAFNSAANAVKSACRIVGHLNDHNGAGPDYPVHVRIGISAGEPVEQHEDLFGSTVQLAARLCAQADPMQVLVSNVVADLCIGKNLKFFDAGEVQLKGFETPIATRGVEIVC
jgi:class 3 adenylate cyclase